MAKNSIVMICKNIKLDKDYQNCLTYTEQQLYNLCYTNKVDIASNFSFVQDENESLLVPFTYENCLKCNYMAFQNPRYSNKWFFAFIESVNYVSDKTTRINFSVDVFSTWFENWTATTCFVEREHVNDDTIGKHTVAEQLETGDYIEQVFQSDGSDLTPNYLNPFHYVVALSDWPFDMAIPHSYIYNGLFSGFMYLVFNSPADLYNFIVDIQDETSGDPINSIFVIPQFLDGLDDEDFENWTSQSWKAAFMENTNSQMGYSSVIRIIDRHIIDDNYQPTNNKLLVYPYRYLLLSNNAGSTQEYRYEWFFNKSNYGGQKIGCEFMITGVASPGCNIKMYPQYYGQNAIPTNLYSLNNLYALDLGKLPTCSWWNDTYTNWLTQNAVNIPLQGISNVTNTIGNLATGNIGGTLTGVKGIISQVGEIYSHSLAPNTGKGGVNQGNLNFSSKIGYNLYRMSIRKEHAKIIDDYFTRFGYQINEVKLPNQTGRTYFNFVKIGNSEIIGYPNSKGCPADAMETINNIYRNGVTLWHSHDRIGNYTGNTIINQQTP